MHVVVSSIVICQGFNYIFNNRRVLVRYYDKGKMIMKALIDTCLYREGPVAPGVEYGQCKKNLISDQALI